MQTKPTWRTVARAFWRALQMTLRGQTYTPPSPAHPDLRAWVEQGKGLINRVFQAADAQGLNEAARKEWLLTLEGRPMSAQTILSAIDHNFSREYGLLLDSGLEHSILTLTAFNMNDQYRLKKLTESLTQMPAFQQVLQELSAHLVNMPRAQPRI